MEESVLNDIYDMKIEKDSHREQATATSEIPPQTNFSNFLISLNTKPPFEREMTVSDTWASP
jgi:hypothetical protein